MCRIISLKAVCDCHFAWFKDFFPNVLHNPCGVTCYSSTPSMDGACLERVTRRSITSTCPGIYECCWQFHSYNTSTVYRIVGNFHGCWPQSRDRTPRTPNSRILFSWMLGQLRNPQKFCPAKISPLYSRRLDMEMNMSWGMLIFTTLAGYKYYVLCTCIL